MLVTQSEEEQISIGKLTNFLFPVRVKKGNAVGT